MTKLEKKIKRFYKKKIINNPNLEEILRNLDYQASEEKSLYEDDFLGRVNELDKAYNFPKKPNRKARVLVRVLITLLVILLIFLITIWRRSIDTLEALGPIP